MKRNIYILLIFRHMMIMSGDELNIYCTGQRLKYSLNSFINNFYTAFPTPEAHSAITESVTSVSVLALTLELPMSF